MNQQKQMIASMGQFLGEEVLHVMRGMQRMDSDVQIYGGQKRLAARAASARIPDGLGLRGLTKTVRRWKSDLDC